MTQDKKPKTAAEMLAQVERIQHRKGAADERVKAEQAADEVEIGLGLPAWVRAPLGFIIALLRPLIGWCWRLVVGLIGRFSRSKDGGASRLRRVLATGIVGGLSLFVAWFAVFKVVPLAGQLAYDAVLVEGLAVDGVSVFSKPDYVAGAGNVLSVFSCRRYPCEAQTDSIEFRMRDSLYLDVKRFLTKLEPHDPGELAGAFLSEENACRYRSYGRRVKIMGFYPQLVSATCLPVNGDNAAELVEQLRAMDN